MKAIAVLPGKPDSAHLAELAMPSVDDVPDGRGVLVRVLRVGVDGTDKEINAAEYGAAPDGQAFLVIGHEGFGRVEAVGPNVREVAPGDYVVATVRRPGTSFYDVIGTKDMTTDRRHVLRARDQPAARFPHHRFSTVNGHVLAAFGMTPAYMRSERRGFSTFEWRLALPGALRAGDFVLVRSGLAHVGKSSIRILHRMTEARTGALVATLDQSGVCLDLDARRPAPLADDFRERTMGMLVIPVAAGDRRSR